MSTASMPCAPTAILFMYTAAPGKNIVPRSATAMTAIAFGWPSAVNRVPSSGSTATSTSGPVPSPTGSPLKSIGASSFSPSPITTTPSIETESSIARIASTAAWSAAILSPRPTQRPAPIAADSVTRTSSSARFRSGRTGARGLPLASPRRSLATPAWRMSGLCPGIRLIPSGENVTAEPFGPVSHPRRPWPDLIWCRSHPLRGLDANEIEAPRDHVLHRADEREPERLRLAPQHAVLVVEAVEVVGDADRVDRNRLRPPPFRRLRGDDRKLQQPLDQLALFGLQ